MDTTGKTFRCTNTLRWRPDEFIALTEATHVKLTPVLQQAWQCVETGEVVWIDVPKMTSNAGDNPPQPGR